MSETVVSSVESVTGTPARCSRASGWAARPRRRSRPARSRWGRGPASRRASVSSAQSAGSSMVPGPWAIRSGSIASARRTCAAPPHSPAWSVIRRPPARAASNAAACWPRIRVGGLRPGEVPAGQALVAEAGRGLGEDEVRGGVVRAQRGADEPDDRAGPGRARRGARRTRPRSRPRAARRPRRGAAGPSGSPRTGRSRPPSSRPARAVIRSSASASCISAIGRSNASRSCGLVDARHRRDQRRATSRSSRAARRPRGSGRGRGRSRRGASRRGGGGARPSASPRPARRRGGRHPSMLRFRAHVHHPGHGRATASSAAGPSRPCSAPAIGVVAMVRTPTPATSSATACRPPGATASRRGSPTSREPATLGAPVEPASTRSCTSWPSRSTATAAPSCSGSTPAGRATSSPRRPTPASAASSTWARWAWSTTRRCTTRARRRRRRRSSASPGSTGRSSSRRSSSARATASSTSSPTSSGVSPGIVPVPGDGRSRFQPIHGGDVARIVVRCLADPGTIGGTFDLGGPRYWTYREITAEVARGAREAAAGRPAAGAAHLARGGHGRDGPPAVPGRHRPAPPAAASTTSARSTSIGPRFGVRAAADGGRPRVPAREAPRPADPRRPRRAARTAVVSGRGGRLLGTIGWLVAVVAIAFGAAGLTVAMQPSPDRPARPELTSAGDQGSRAHLDAAEADRSTRCPRDIDALGTQARGALAAMIGRRDRHAWTRPSPTGNGLIARVRSESAAIRAELAAAPYVGDAPRASSACRPSSASATPRSSAWRPRRDRPGPPVGAPRRPAARRPACSRRSSRSTTGSSGSPPTQGRQAKYKEAIATIDSAAADRSRPRTRRATGS